MLNSSLVKTFIYLIPKKDNANRVKEFQSIRFITCV